VSRCALRPAIVLEPTRTGVHFRGRAAWSAVLSGGIQHVALVVAPGGVRAPSAARNLDPDRGVNLA
jgi:hypothetical protein